MIKKRYAGKKTLSSPSDIFHVISRIDREGIEISRETIREWRKIVNFAAEIIEVSCAIIRRNDPPDLELVVSSDSDENLFAPGDRGPADKYYCGQVIGSGKNCIITNGRKEKKSRMSRDFKHGMVSTWECRCSGRMAQFTARYPCLTPGKENFQSDLKSF